MNSLPAPERTLELRFVLLAALPALLLAAAQAAWSWPFFSDDSFISLRFAARLLAGEGLSWTDGEVVEGYSNLLWVLACAGLGALGLDLVDAARWLGAACTAGALVLLARAARPHDLRTAVGAAGAPLLVAAAAPVMAWTLAGLEGPMVLLWLAWGGAAALRLLDAGRPTTSALLRAGLPFALLCLTRPDGPLWAATVGTALALALRSNGAPALRALLSFGALPAAAFAGQLAFRAVYHGDCVPNTAHVKVEVGSAMLHAGLGYVGAALWAIGGLAALAALATAALARTAGGRRIAWCLLLPTGAWFGYLASVGGDHFPGYRLALPALAPLGLLVAAAARDVGRAAFGTVLAIAAAVFGTAANVWLSRTDPLSVFVRAETWEWRGKALGEVLRAAFRTDRPLLAVDAAGALPYYSELPALDMLGLCDRTIAQSPPPDFLPALLAANGRALLQGHMRGNGAYVMDRAPDLLLFGNPPGLPLPVFVSALQFEADPRFLGGYRCVVLETGERELLPGQRENVRSPLWVRIEGRAGVRRSADRIEVPAWLLGAYRQPRAFRFSYAPPAPTDADFADWKRELEATWHWFTGRYHVAAVPTAAGPLQLELRSAAPARLDLTMPAGTWWIAAEPAAPGLQLTLDGATATDGGYTVADGSGPLALVATAAPDAALPLRLSRVVVTRVR